MRAGGPLAAQRLDRDGAQDGRRDRRGRPLRAKPGGARLGRLLRALRLSRCAASRFPSSSRGSSRSTRPSARARTATAWAPGARSTPIWCSAIPSISILEGVILPWGEPTGYLRKVVLPTLAKAFKFDLNAPWGEHSAAAQHALLHGAPGRFKFQTDGARGRSEYESDWEGVLKNVERRYRESSSDAVRVGLEEFMIEQPCQTCGGKRLKAESLAVLVHGREHRRRGGPAGRAGDRVLREHSPSRRPDGGRAPRERHTPAWTRTSRDRSSRKSPTGCASCATWDSTTSRSAAARPRSPAARPSASGSPPRSAPGWWACSTSWTSRASGCTSGTTSGCSPRSADFATWAIP